MTAIDPGEGWRLLVEGELIPENAEWEKHKGDWTKADIRYHVGGKWTAKQWVPFRVPIKPIDNIGVEVTTSGPCVAIEVHRAALAEIERLKAELNAVKQPQPSPEPEWFDLTPFGEHVWRSCDEAFLPSRGQWLSVYMANAVGASISEMRRVGYTQFRCLLKDAPPELVAKTSGLTKAKEIVESLPEGQRNVLVASTMASRPQQPKTEREVLLYWYDGNVVGRYADCPPTDQSFIPLIVRDGKVFIETETREVVR